MREIMYRDALREAMAEEMRRDPSVFLMGEDVAEHGGNFLVTTGLYEEFGEQRVFDTPLSESALVGAGVGAAMMGMRPIVEVMFADFVTIAMDAIANHAAKVYYMSGGWSPHPWSYGWQPTEPDAGQAHITARVLSHCSPTSPG